MNKVEVRLNGNLVGHVYKSTHGVWVAQPVWGSYSCSFSSEEKAKLELLLHASNQEQYNAGKGMVVH